MAWSLHVIDATLSTQDFGLAVAIQKDNDDDRYELTGGTGSRRYMAPEVCREEPYGASSSV